MNGAAVLAESIAQVAKRAVEGSDGSGFTFGEVTGVAPLEIMLEQRLLLPADVLVLTDAVIASVMRLEGEGYEEYEGRKVYAVTHNMTLGDKVLLAKAAGGQMWVILSKYYATE